VYQGEELGMTNFPFTEIEQYRDLESVNHFHEAVAHGADPAELLPRLAFMSRDNARTPVQWDASAHAGFTTGEPWIAVNPNYPAVNAAAALGDDDSVFHHYRRLIELRHAEPAVADGSLTMQLAEHEQLYAYTRTLGPTELFVIANLSSAPADVPLDDWERGELALASHHGGPATDGLGPWEARVYRR
jgi:oligo-1,6-glucosidase